MYDSDSDIDETNIQDLLLHGDFFEYSSSSPNSTSNNNGTNVINNVIDHVIIWIHFKLIQTTLLINKHLNW